MIRHPAPHTIEPEMPGEMANTKHPYARDDVRLLQRVIDHDEQAFTKLYKRYAPLVQRSLKRSLRQPCLVDEVLNDVMLVLWQDAAHFPPAVPVGAWLHGIAKHKAYKALRRQAAAVARPPSAENLAHAPADPETLLLHNEQATQLSQELAAMPPTDRLLLEKLLQGCSYQEMAQQTGAPLNTVKVRMMRARRRLVQRCSASHFQAEAEA